MKRTYLAFVILILLGPELAFAAGGGGSAGLSSLLWPACNFTIFAGLMYWIYLRNVKGLLKARSVSIKEHLGRAKKDLLEAEENYKNLYNRLNDIETEKRELFARFDTEGANLSKIILENAIEAAKRIASDSKRQIDSELNQTTKGLKLVAISRAIQIAEDQLKANLTEDQDKLLRADALRCLIEEGEVQGQISAQKGA